MTKIYEALVNASRQQSYPEPVHPQPPALQLEPTVSLTGKTNDTEMVTLYHAIESLLPGLNKRLIQFISSHPFEGTSTISRDFALFNAKQLHKRVLLIDSNRTRPSQNQFFGIPKTTGWQELVTRQAGLIDLLHPTRFDNLFLYPSSNSSKVTPGIFDPNVIHPFMESLRDQFELVVIDAPPMSQSPDGLAVAPCVDGVILVVEAEKTRWKVVEHNKNRLAASGATLLGVVLNKRQYYVPDWIYRRLR